MYLATHSCSRDSTCLARESALALTIDIRDYVTRIGNGARALYSW